MLAEQPTEGNTTDHVLWSDALGEVLAGLAQRGVSPEEERLRAIENVDQCLGWELPLAAVPDLALRVLVMYESKRLGSFTDEGVSKWLELFGPQEGRPVIATKQRELLEEYGVVVSRERWKRKWRILPREPLSRAAGGNRPWRNAPCGSLLSRRLKGHPGWAC
jgi:hypothetical protein